MDTQADELLDKREAAARLRISIRSIDNRIRDRTIPFVKIGKAVRFIAADLNRFIQTHRIEGRES